MLNTDLTVDLSLVLLLALVTRLLSLPLLWRSQRTLRARAVATAAGAAPPGVGPVVGDLAVCVVVATALEVLMNVFLNAGFDVLRSPAAFADEHPLGVAIRLHTASLRIWLWLVSALLVGALLLLTHRVGRALLTVGMPPEVASDGRFRRRGRIVLGVLAVLAVLVLPLGVVIGALVFQTVALITARRHPAPLPAAPIGQPYAQPYGQPYGQAYAQPQGQPWGQPYVQPHAQPAAQPFAPPATAVTAPATALAAPSPPAVPPAAPPVPVRAAAQVPHQPLSGHEPRSIGGYQLLGRIGSGGMGTVYLARREGAATQVALKTINLELLDDPDLLRRFQRESEVLAMVPGAYTARVLDTGVDAGRPFLAMELLDGRPLDTHLRENGPVRSPEALRALGLALAVALSGVHRLGLVHRDLKPANIMLTSAGPRLLDFGIAALVDGTRLTMTGAGPGTLTYMAPEQFGEERVGTAADIWAWACCVVCAAHGASPFAATSTGGVIRRIIDTGPDQTALATVRSLDPALADVVARALTPDPAARPADGTALLALLTSAQPDGTTDVREEITRGWSTLRL
ncbi:protein kinase [Kitasatospora sp. NPDC059673]|uniref:protein kinase domain-containing protein n=1 Tax=Kitasatospora sp. NPDC059673 TaxID=3346901 RepID=UPI00367D8B4A